MEKVGDDTSFSQMVRILPNSFTISLWRQNCIHLLIIFLFSPASRISASRDRHDSESLPKRHVQTSSLWKQQIFSLIALVSLGTTSEAKEELNTRFHTIFLLFLVWILGISLRCTISCWMSVNKLKV